MKAIAWFEGGHMRDIPLADEQVAAFAAEFGPHQALADELREQHGAQRVIVRCMGSFVAESEEVTSTPLEPVPALEAGERQVPLSRMVRVR